ncbi:MULTISPECIES: hypothetical protein [unclassified Pseudoalteromonas]|uniref:hypothetical protein n=1 Tax=unclassified Pseudoalteromonas TaxID=194690 RepID=UPI001F335185|nr:MULTISPECIES: hypothetical protein [unclassified Pseudoalteromonas]MCF2829766.1 hypothetical protein [Pseudoalteromonas sp. OF5H-5]MCF2832165.1 hypothetical protein [Pseudoalteromonas sp. DL2-H6]MCF2927732.1 hypothetical protein [Pseudoalteromonas sp. DL2-H1]
MINYMFENFERTEFSDEIYSIFGRALTIATRFESSCKALANSEQFRFLATAKRYISDDEFHHRLKNISKKHKNLHRAIVSLGYEQDINNILSEAREARNKLIHTATLDASDGFDFLSDQAINNQLKDIEEMVIKIIKGDTIASILLSILNKKPIPINQLGHNYERKYLNWVMQRFES